ncbi:MAG: hypothetical protein QXQ29_03445 [Candidatus Bathyarchaeia archaeon]
MYSTPYEDILAVFERRSDRVPWNIRHEFWYHYNFARGVLPDRYRGMGLIDVCLEWGASWRCYSGYFTDSFIRVSYAGDVCIERVMNGKAIITWLRTPKGVVKQVSLRDEYGLTSRIIEYPVKSLDDFKPLEYMLENLEVIFDSETYFRMERNLRGQGIVSYFFPRSPYQRLILEYMGFERTVRFLSRYRSDVEGFMEVIRSSDRIFYDVVAGTPIKILNLGENIDVRMTPPKIFEKYCLPYYQERADYLHRRGKYVHIHVDGYARQLLPLLRESGLDGVEALTVKPVGDMTLGDIEKHLGDDMIILDGIPYIYFIPEAVGLDKFEEFVERIVSMFRGRLILGVSDELPPPADVSRVGKVSEIIDRILRS